MPSQKPALRTSPPRRLVRPVQGWALGATTCLAGEPDRAEPPRSLRCRSRSRRLHWPEDRRVSGHEPALETVVHSGIRGARRIEDERSLARKPSCRPKDTPRSRASSSSTLVIDQKSWLVHRGVSSLKRTSTRPGEKFHAPQRFEWSPRSASRCE